MRLAIGLAVLGLLAGSLLAAGCAQQQAPPPATINDWMKMEQPRP